MGNKDVSIALAATHYLCVAPHCIKQHVRCKKKDGLNLTKWTISHRPGFCVGLRLVQIRRKAQSQFSIVKQNVLIPTNWSIMLPRLPNGV